MSPPDVFRAFLGGGKSVASRHESPHAFVQQIAKKKSSCFLVALLRTRASMHPSLFTLSACNNISTSGHCHHNDINGYFACHVANIANLT